MSLHMQLLYYIIKIPDKNEAFSYMVACRSQIHKHSFDVLISLFEVV